MKWLFIIVCLAALGFAVLYFHSDLTIKEIEVVLGIALALAIVGGAPALAVSSREPSHGDDDSVTDGIKLLVWGIFGVACIIAFIVGFSKFLDWRGASKAKHSSKSVQSTRVDAASGRE
jgi:hypothetical protein